METRFIKYIDYKYSNKILEFYNEPLSEQELIEMANASYKVTGIPNVVLWIGPNPNSHGMRIKVSNIPNKFDGGDCFTLTIPDFKIVGVINKKFITNIILNKIKEFVELNMENIVKYSNYEIETYDFINNLKKVK
jgi:hypothetical protein